MMTKKDIKKENIKLVLISAAILIAIILYSFVLFAGNRHNNTEIILEQPTQNKQITLLDNQFIIKNNTQIIIEIGIYNPTNQLIDNPEIQCIKNSVEFSIIKQKIQKDASIFQVEIKSKNNQKLIDICPIKANVNNNIITKDVMIKVV